MQTATFPDNPDQPLTVLQEIWQHLELAPSTRDAPWRLLTLGTWDGETPQLRTVVLRKTSTQQRQLSIYSDARAQKIWQINEHPHVSLLFYDPTLQIQIRAQGEGTIITDQSQLDDIWNPLPPAARKMYLAPMKPGSPLNQPTPNLPPDIISRDPTLEESQQGRPNFAVINITIDKIDWLYLKKEGHVRAKFTYINNEWQGTWIAT